VPFRDQRGLTLLELLVSMVLLATALAGLAASSPYAMMGVVAGGRQTAATLLAQACVEVARTLPADRLPSDLPAACPAEVPGFPGMTRAVEVTPGAPTSGTLTVAVAVTFRDRQGPRTARVATVVAR
jgi:prepilin-type N-terminal cleavage/methylation domain-containing protein